MTTATEKYPATVTGPGVEVSEDRKHRPIAVLVDAAGEPVARFQVRTTLQRTDRKPDGTWTGWRDATDSWPTVPQWARPLILKVLKLSTQF